MSFKAIPIFANRDTTYMYFQENNTKQLALVEEEGFSSSLRFLLKKRVVPGKVYIKENLSNDARAIRILGENGLQRLNISDQACNLDLYLKDGEIISVAKRGVHINKEAKDLSPLTNKWIAKFKQYSKYIKK